MINRIVLNETSYFGRGAREKLSEEIKARHFQKILVVTDKSFTRNRNGYISNRCIRKKIK